jgi:hypothetical protein
MESKHNYGNDGTVQLRASIKSDISNMGGSTLDDVHPDDKHCIAVIINYCATTIARKHQEIRYVLFPVPHRTNGDIVFYTLYVSFPLSTVFDDDQTAYIKTVSCQRITDSIKLCYSDKAGPPCQRMEIIIYSLKYMPEIEVQSVVQLHLKKANRLSICYEKEDDQRGSTKRTRLAMEHEK